MTVRVYHWKHGWIPLDHAAALSKAKGSETGARSYPASHPEQALAELLSRVMSPGTARKTAARWARTHH